VPFYDYECPECGEKFDLIRSVDERDEPVTCPRCGKQDRMRKTDWSAVSIGRLGSSGSTCLPSGGG